MLGGLRGVSPSSETMSEGTLERNRIEKALISKTPTHSQLFQKNVGVKNYSDKNGNDVTKAVHKGRKTFAFWTLVCLLFILAIGNLMLTFTILAVLRLGQGMESMEFLPEHNAIKFFGDTDLEHLYKKDGLIESFRDTPMTITSENGSVLFNLQIKPSRYENKLTVNTSGIFVRGVNALELIDPDSGEMVFSTASSEMNIPDGVKNLHARQISVKRITAPVDEDLNLRTESSAHLRGAEGTHMESKELFWSADQDIYLKSINGSVVLSGKEGVFIDVRPSRYENKLTVNTSGIFVRGVNALELIDPDSGEMVFSTASSEMNIPDGVKNLHARQISVKRITAPVDEDLNLRTESSAHLRGAEGTHMESKELFWSADQDIYLKSINGSVVLSGKEGVFIDVRYLPIAVGLNNKTDKYSHGTGQFKVCVCMPQGKLFRIAVPTGQKVTCSHINMTGDMNPCV